MCLDSKREDKAGRITPLLLPPMFFFFPPIINRLVELLGYYYLLVGNSELVVISSTAKAWYGKRYEIEDTKLTRWPSTVMECTSGKGLCLLLVISKVKISDRPNDWPLKLPSNQVFKF